MTTIIEEALQKSISYEDYRNLILAQISADDHTAAIAPALLQYTILSNSRMKRLDKTFTLALNDRVALSSFDTPMIWLVITEGWCGDASQIVPVLNKMATVAENIDLRIVLRDENDTLMNLFLTDGKKAIPKLITLDANTNDVIFTWGPRPKPAVEMVKKELNINGSFTTDFKAALQQWYNADKGRNVVNEILELLGVLKSV